MWSSFLKGLRIIFDFELIKKEEGMIKSIRFDKFEDFKDIFFKFACFVEIREINRR